MVQRSRLDGRQLEVQDMTWNERMRKCVIKYCSHVPHLVADPGFSSPMAHTLISGAVDLAFLMD